MPRGRAPYRLNSPQRALEPAPVRLISPDEIEADERLDEEQRWRDIVAGRTP